MLRRQQGGHKAGLLLRVPWASQVSTRPQHRNAWLAGARGEPGDAGASIYVGEASENSLLLSLYYMTLREKLNIKH